MKKRTFVFFVLCLQPVLLLQAQEEWTKEDSVWLEDVKSGKIKLKLNEETMKAIESGTLVNPDASMQGKQQVAPSKIPITKEFTGIDPLKSTSPNLSSGMKWLRYKRLAISDTLNDVNIMDLPPSVFWHYEPEYEPVLELPSFTIYGSDVEYLKAISPGVITFSIEDIARSIFWPSHRAKRRNAKKANAWKTYHSIP